MKILLVTVVEDDHNRLISTQVLIMNLLFKPSYWQNSSSGIGGGYKSGFNSTKQNCGNSAPLLPISKDNYKPVASVKTRAQSEVDRWMADNDVTVNGDSVPCPVFEFEESTFPGFCLCSFTFFRKFQSRVFQTLVLG